MARSIGFNRRYDVTGLEEPDELWERLKEANEQVKSLGTSNKKLSARVRVLERQLSEVGGLTDDELIAELPRRMSKALESAQGLGNEIVRRASEREVMIRQKALTDAADLRQQAEAEAADIRARAGTDAATYIAAAKVEAQRVVAAAQNRRDEVLFGLRAQAEEMERQIAVLREQRTRLAGAYDIVERTLAAAKAALRGDEEHSQGLAEPHHAPIYSKERSPSTVRSVPEDRKRLAVLGGSGPDRHATVYDWSPAESHVG